VTVRQVTSNRASASAMTLSGRRREIRVSSMHPLAVRDPLIRREQNDPALGSDTPSTSTSDRIGPIWRGGKFTTAITCRPTSVSGS
jgi:hypothetical protein